MSEDNSHAAVVRYLSLLGGRLKQPVRSDH